MYAQLSKISHKKRSVRTFFLLILFACIFSFNWHTNYALAEESAEVPQEEPFHNLTLSYPWEIDGYQYDSVLVAAFTDCGSLPGCYSFDENRILQIFFKHGEFEFDFQSTVGGRDADGYFLAYQAGPDYVSNVSTLVICDYTTSPTAFVDCNQLHEGQNVGAWQLLGYMMDPIFFQWAGNADFSDYPNRATTFGIPEILAQAIEDPINFSDYDTCDTADWACFIQGFLVDILKNLSLAIYPEPGYFSSYWQRYQDLINERFPVFSSIISIFDNADFSGSDTFTSPELTIFGKTGDVIDTSYLVSSGFLGYVKTFISIVLYLFSAEYGIACIRRMFGHHQLTLPGI